MFRELPNGPAGSEDAINPVEPDAPVSPQSSPEHMVPAASSSEQTRLPNSGEFRSDSRPRAPVRHAGTPWKAAALLTALFYMTLSLASVNDARMLRVAVYAIVALAFVWFSKVLGARFDIPKWTGAVMGAFLFVFPVVVFLVLVVANSLRR